MLNREKLNPGLGVANDDHGLVNCESKYMCYIYVYTLNCV